MIEVLYFARIREDLDVEREQLEWTGGISDVAALIAYLCDERGAAWSTTLRQENLLVSVNQAMVNTDHQLADGDEVAFFPPVTGG
ncbi:MAG: molybdopterin converting factor subunit 1 [Pseudomonadales bacterium]|jgi:molybdopterin synthase sulfur carrier subunit|nr:molybdopterin converting factor subunit 1 [Pseudomonadales bacterium]MDP7146496.1 molybdopterin converting factor subunit 1 [Pseudomonadales bacterium]MDP7358290.1 molybdopterin converting factor subunit 1 [Pseudomonadales bacterium]MDP7597771.1 molybdopterin converting factor subunit 1 [Pseudomonadales bacterium]HJN52342.1 molybdopterin converting factor subunit 1 [Pseudomonadales bacterium]|tara:strand:- start:1288 stop:1542 length:255 start_codon:yes stop_codon:yes gene_type:complete